VRNRRARFAAREKKADRLSPGVSIIVIAALATLAWAALIVLATSIYSLL
jgi:hypothetical protein